MQLSTTEHEQLYPILQQYDENPQVQRMRAVSYTHLKRSKCTMKQVFRVFWGCTLAAALALTAILLLSKDIIYTQS